MQYQTSWINFFFSLCLVKITRKSRFWPYSQTSSKQFLCIELLDVILSSIFVHILFIQFGFDFKDIQIVKGNSYENHGV